MANIFYNANSKYLHLCVIIYTFRPELGIGEASRGEGQSTDKARCHAPGSTGYDITVTHIKL